MVEYAYDIMDRVTNISWKTTSGATLGGFGYEYDAVGRIMSRSHAIGSNAFDRAYAYDDLDRLASDGGVTYTYDAAGNRTTRTENGLTTTYTLGIGDRLASWTGGAYTYDFAGNVTRIERDGRPTLDLTWNSQYQLVSVATNGVFVEGYECDALGRRVSMTSIEGMTRHVYDEDWQVIADLDEDGNVVASYVWGDGIDRLLAVKVGGASYYPLTDIQGTVWGYVDSQNNVVARWRYDAWGNALSEEVAEGAAELRVVRYRFQGREYSAATGLTNFRMRWYDAVTGRWLSKDPIGLSGGLNLYAFCGNDSVINADYYGLAYIGYRPLDAGGEHPRKQYALGFLSGLNFPGNLDVRHAEIFFEDGLDSEDCPSHIGYGPSGPHKDTSPIPYTDRGNGDYDDYLMRKAVGNVIKRQEWSGGRYNKVSHNCQDFVAAVINEYDRLLLLSAN